MAKEFISHYGIIAKNNSTISGSLIVTNGITGSFTGSLVGSLTGTASYASQTLSSSFSSTSSYVNTLNQDLTFNGNLTLNGTASITYLNVAYESSSIIYSSGSNQFGDATNDVQLLIGTTKVSGSFEVTGSANVTTSLTTPLIIGGSSTTQTLTYKTTTGIGTTDAHIFQVGNNGATEAMRILNNGNVGIGTTSPDVFSIGGSHKLLTVTSASGAASGILSLQGGPTGTGVIYLGNSTPIAHAAVGSLNGSNLAFYTNNSNTGTTLTERLRITSAGNVGIGTTPTTSYNLHIGKNLTGSASPVGVFNAGQIQSDATTDVAYFQVRASTAAGAYVIPDLYHYYFSTSALGAGSSITNQYGYYASAITQATNNYGFYGNLSANATRWNIYMGGTAQNYFAGNVGIGTATVADIIDAGSNYSTLTITGTTGASNGCGIVELSTNSSLDATNRDVGFIDFMYQQNTTNAASKRVAYFGGLSDGVAANDRGGKLNFYTRLNGSTTADSLLRMTIINNGNVGIGVTVPTAVLHLKAGTTTSSSSPLKFISGTNNTTAEIGAMEYDGTSLFFTNGGVIRQQLSQVQHTRVSSIFSVTNSSTLVAVTGLTANLAAGKNYEFEAVLHVNGGVGAGSKHAISGTVGVSNLVYEILMVNNSTLGITLASRQSTLGGFASEVATTTGYCTIRGVITTSTSGTLTVNFAQAVAMPAITSSILRGSTFKVTQIP